MTRKSTERTAWKKWIQLAWGMAITGIFFYMLAPFLIPIFIGAILAILCYPIQWKISQKLPKSLTALLVTLLVTLGALVPFVLVIVNLAYQVAGVLNGINFSNSAQMSDWVVKIQDFMDHFSPWLPFDKEWMQAQLLNLLRSILEIVSSLVTSFLSSIPSFFLAFSMVILSFFFFNLDGYKFLNFIAKLSPIPVERAEWLYRAFERSCRGVVLGLLLSSFVQAILVCIFFLITSMPHVVLFSVAAFLMGMVPIVGTLPITLGAIIYLFIQHQTAMAIVMIVGAVIIGTADNVVRPWILKGHSEMHPLLALVSTFGAIHLFGATGLFLGPIIAAVFVAFLRLIANELDEDTRNELNA